MSKIKLIAIMGKAGSGKDTILRNATTMLKTEDLEKYNKCYHKVIPFTTRLPRDDEVDGYDYHFVGAEQITDWVENGSIAQIADFNGWLYGTTWDAYDEGKINIGIFSPKAIEHLQDYGDMYISVIQVTASDKERLLRQLNREDNPSVKEIVRRYLADEEDFSEKELKYLEPYINISTSEEVNGNHHYAYAVPGEQLKNIIIKLSGKEV